MELLDKANTETYGIPAPTEVPLTVEKGPFIVITGHDLKDLKALLEQFLVCELCVRSLLRSIVGIYLFVNPWNLAEHGNQMICSLLNCVRFL